MKDDFRDGNFTENPRWDELAGEYAIDPKNGLHSVAYKPEPSEQALLAESLTVLEAEQVDNGRFNLIRSETLANRPFMPVGEEIERVKAAISATNKPSAMQTRLAQLKAIRNDSGRFTLVQSLFLSGKPDVPVGEEIVRTQEAVDKEPSAKVAEMAAQANTRSELFTRLDISNSFSVQLEMVSRAGDGRFEMDIFQGRRRGSGYRLAYNDGTSPSFEIIRFGRSGARLLAAYKSVVNLEDGYHHRIRLVRDDTGGMTLSLDGGALLQNNDKRFRDRFAGITPAN